ncbi:response regulator [Zavarzinella formosa]|uniref:response regulator n=1 Tax=Zavarzinella formosa TaxID=360055 RepID=UPI0002E0D06A|nr:response regulator [Zavarzinella formosa]
MTGEMMKLTRVLVVDDNEDAATSFGELLNMAGYQVKTAFNGREALLVAESFRPEACVLDINMPEMDGYQLARQLRDQNPDHPPVFATVTAKGDYGHLGQAVEAGFDLHFTKPADPQEVMEQLEWCMGKQVG